MRNKSEYEKRRSAWRRAKLKGRIDHTFAKLVEWGTPDVVASHGIGGSYLAAFTRAYKGEEARGVNRHLPSSGLMVFWRAGTECRRRKLEQEREAEQATITPERLREATRILVINSDGTVEDHQS
jgi:hypothetical protein